MKDLLHHLFIPRESNNHRARLLHAQPLLLLVAILLVINFMTPKIAQRYPSVLGVTANISIDDLVRLTNIQRKQAGLTALSLNPKLSQAATMKAHYMFEKNFWAHNAPDGTTPWLFIKSSGYQYIYAGENLARGFNTANDAMNAWMASPGHRENILSPNYNDVGFAVSTGSLTGEDTVLIVEMFGSSSKDTADVDTKGDATANAPVVTSQPKVIAKTRVMQIPEPTLTPRPSQIFPTPEPLITGNGITITPNGTYYIAGISTHPLIDKNFWSRMLSIVIAVIFIGMFLLDTILIERKQIARIVSHNLDHIMFLTTILLGIILFTTGGII